MLTYQDLIKVGENENQKKAFVKRCISDWKASSIYRTAWLGEEYAKKQNPTIKAYRKMLYTISGREVPDIYSSNYKLTSGFFDRFTTQQNQFLLGNGVNWSDDATNDKLGKDFDYQLQKAGLNALIGGVSFGFFNLDHLEVFKATEFVPLYDEDNGSLMSGVRFWQVSPSKPTRATLYEPDGYTDYLWNKENPNGIIIDEKRQYIINVKSTDADGVIIYEGENYPSFPIVPLYANPYKQSELIGIREQIDAYDLIRSGYCNNIDECSFIYWTINNAGGMDDIDLAQFVQRMKTVKASVISDDGARAESHTLDVPYASREAILSRLENDLYRDYMALNTERIANGNITATQIKASYEPMNNKADRYEYELLKFLDGICNVAGIEGENPTFTRSLIVNVSEEITSLIQSAQYLSEDYVTKRILNLFGDGDKFDEVNNEIMNSEVDSYNLNGNGNEFGDE